MDDAGIVAFILHIGGAAALLIWAVRMVRTGVERAYSVQLRSFLRRSNANRLQALANGAVAAVCLQSATAVAVLVSNFAAKGGVGLLAGLAILLGADVGSALVSQVLLLRQDFLVPLFLLIGVILFLRSLKGETRQLGRILIGVALIFVSLDMIRSATGPLIDSAATVSVMQYLGGDIVISFLIGALFAWLVHSSVAAVLFFVTLTAQGLLPASGAAAMVLGANAGGAFIAYMLTLSAPLASRRMVVANLALRGGGAALVLVMLSQGEGSLAWLGANDARRIINLHLVFNIGLAIASLPVLSWIVALTERMVPEQTAATADLIRTTALDSSTLDRPDRALICAGREVMQMGEHTESTLRAVIALFENWDEITAKAIREKAGRVGEMHEAIKHFLAQLSHKNLNEDERQQSDELAAIAFSLATAADAIGRGLTGQAKRLGAGGVAFSESGQREIEGFHDRVLSNAQMALHVLMSREPDVARQLLRAKDKARTVEQDLQDRHLMRLREGVQESFETSRIHQETLRTLKDVNTSFAKIGYPIMSRSGDLLSTRLSKDLSWRPTQRGPISSSACGVTMQRDPSTG